MVRASQASSVLEVGSTQPHCMFGQGGRTYASSSEVTPRVCAGVLLARARTSSSMRAASDNPLHSLTQSRFACQIPMIARRASVTAERYPHRKPRSRIVIGKRPAAVSFWHAEYADEAPWRAGLAAQAELKVRGGGPGYEGEEERTSWAHAPCRFTQDVTAGMA